MRSSGGGEIERRDRRRDRATRSSGAVLRSTSGAIDEQDGAAIDDRRGAIVRLELGLWSPAKSLLPLSLRSGLSLFSLPLSLSLSLSLSENELK